MLNISDIKAIHKNPDGTFDVQLNASSNGYKFFTTDWKEIPRFDTKGNKIEPEEFERIQVAKHGLVYFKQNFENEFIGSSYTLINAESLKKLKSEQFKEKLDSKLKIYRYPENHHDYIISVDTAKDGSDGFSVQVIDVTNILFEQVASANLQVDYLEMPIYINSWGLYYNNAFLIIENNEGSGQSVADQMYKVQEYSNLYFDKGQNNKRKKYPGFRTTAKSRSLILKTLKMFIENDKLIIHDEETINQFFTFILMNNKYQADEGCKDDLIMSLALAFAPFCNIKNFNDLAEITKKIHSKTTESQSFSNLLAISNFDDYTDESIEQSGSRFEIFVF